LHKLERAYVFARVEQIGFEENNKKRTFNLKVNFHNHGKTPAILKVLRQVFEVRDTMPEELPVNPKANREMPAGLVIGSDKDWDWKVHEDISEDQFHDMMGANRRAFVYGLLRYEDVMGNSHDVGLCWQTQQEKRNGLQFVICGARLNYFT
jgi:hypothetical protein